MIDSVLKEFGLHKEPFSIRPLGKGLINHTWQVSQNGHDYVLQKINDQVFKNPVDIAGNISLIAEYLKSNNPNYYFPTPVKTSNGQPLVYRKEDGYFRVFPFVSGSHTKDTVDTADQAYEAARQFGKFTRVLHGLDISKLKITIPSFHDLSLRYKQFQEAVQNGNPERIIGSGYLINELQQLSWIVDEYEVIKKDNGFKLRVTHHDTKISNVLFDEENKGICVIDLDTVMPGYFISDLGDMMRTYLTPVSEEETDFKKIEVRPDFYKSVVQGYFSEMKDELTGIEKEHTFYAGAFMIYMQAIRFITDYLNNDIYYGRKYPKHNFNRASNQLVLLQRLLEKKSQLVETQWD